MHELNRHTILWQPCTFILCKVPCFGSWGRAETFWLAWHIDLLAQASFPDIAIYLYTSFIHSLVPSLSAPQIFIAYSMKNRRRKSGRKRHDDACRNVTNLTSWISLGPRNFVPRHQSLVQTAPNSRTALSTAFTDTPTAIYPRKSTYMYV